jgi:hypothetical protein
MSTETATYCARHPREETAVSCASCGTPICTKCMVYTPVGMKCRDCASNKNSSLFQVRPERLILAGLASLVAGVGAALLGEIIGFFVILIGTAYGYFVGSVILKASGMKRGFKLEIIAGFGIVVGAVAFKLTPLLLLTKPSVFASLAFSRAGLLDPFFWLAVGISAACAISKVRYL